MAPPDETSFPGVPVEMLRKWWRLKVLSIDIFLWIAWGWLAVEVVLLLSLRDIGLYNFLVIASIALPVLLIAMVVSAIVDTKAGRVRKKFEAYLVRTV
jgi:glucan phosphoethanolaminetransferase (alkaline phosphatase superfamily)